MSNKIVDPCKTHDYPTFSAAVPISNVVDKTNRNNTHHLNNANKKQNEQYRHNDKDIFIKNIGEQNDDHQDLITRVVGGGIYRNYNKHNVDDSSKLAIDSTHERYNKILSTAMPATENPVNFKDEAERRGLGKSSKSSNNPYFDLRSSTPRELQRHSHSPTEHADRKSVVRERV